MRVNLDILSAEQRRHQQQKGEQRIHTDKQQYTHTHAGTHTHAYTRTHTHIDSRSYSCLSLAAIKYVSYSCSCHTHAHTHTSTHTHIYTRIYTYIDRQSVSHAGTHAFALDKCLSCPQLTGHSSCNSCIHLCKVPQVVKASDANCAVDCAVDCKLYTCITSSSQSADCSFAFLIMNMKATPLGIALSRILDAQSGGERGARAVAVATVAAANCNGKT